jgi:hypothetical protein
MENLFRTIARRMDLAATMTTRWLAGANHLSHLHDLAAHTVRAERRAFVSAPDAIRAPFLASDCR